MMAGEIAPQTSSRRKVVQPNFSNSAHAQVAKSGITAAFGGAELGSDHVPVAGERYDPEYPLRRLKPSPKNPRRLTLDAAGVTAETIELNRKRPDEGPHEWIARCDAYLRTLKEQGETDDSIAVWQGLFDTALSILMRGLLQPIVATPSDVIIAGERRWTSCLLAGLDTSRVLIRPMDEDVQVINRLLENILRANLNVAETCAGVRELVKVATGKPLGPENIDVTADLIQSLMSCKQTQAYYYLAICELPDGDEQLERLLTGYYTSLRTAYQDTAQYTRDLKRAALLGSTPPKPNTEQTGQQQGAQAPQPRKPAAPAVKMPVPGRKSGAVIISALASIKQLPEKASDALQTLEKEWDSLTDKKRRDKLGQALAAIMDGLSVLDSEQEGNA
ncbi:TPA: ParB/RepB/Spo0J family partition protein [Pseudomonas aeruginosa]